MLSDFAEWVWARHHNPLSWYVRPVFILPFCYFAYRRKWKGIALTLLIFPTSLFWFLAPERADPRVVEYLEWEREFVTGERVGAKVLLFALVVVFSVCWGVHSGCGTGCYGLGVLNLGTVLKVAWSVYFGGAAGWGRCCRQG